MGKICTFLSRESAQVAIARWQSLTLERCSPGAGAKKYAEGAVCACARDTEKERGGEVGWCFLLHFLCVTLLCRVLP